LLHDEYAVSPDGMKMFSILDLEPRGVSSPDKGVKLSHVPERGAVRWETPKEYGF